MTKVIQANFAGGEVSDAVAARVDIDKYKTSVYKAENVFVQVHGGLSSRTGLKFIAEAKTPANTVRLIPFEFNTTQTYILEFGHQYMRVYKDGGQVLSTSVTDSINGITVANPAVLTCTGHPFSDGDDVYISGIVGMTQLNQRTFRVSNKDTNTFRINDFDGTAISSAAYTAYSSGGTVSKVFEIATPYAAADLFDIKYVQTADVMTLTHPTYEQRNLTRTDHDAWALSVIEFQPEQAFPTAVAITVNTTGSETDRYVVTAVNRDTSEESLRGLNTTTKNITAITKANPGVATSSSHGFANDDEIYIQSVGGMVEVNNKVFKISGVTTNTFNLTDTTGANVNTTNYTTYTSGGTANQMFVKITNSAATRDNTVAWTAAANAESYNVYREKNGLFGFIGRTESATFTDSNVDPDTTDTPPRTRNPFTGADTYPSTAGYYQQRKLFGNSNTYPQRIYMTQTGNFSNLSVSSPARDDDAITITLSSRQVNEIRHFVSLSDLIVLTSGGEWVISGVDDVITPSGVQAKPQSYFGATEVQPIVAGDIVLFVQPGQTIRDLGYEFSTDSYKGNDVSILARHLLDYNTIIDWSFAQAPHSLIWTTRDDGVMLCLTYSREQQVFAWTRHITQGDFKSVASVREGDDDFSYFVVERKIGTRTTQYVERMSSRDFTDVQDAFFVDSGLTYDSPVTITGFTNANPIVVTAASHGFENGDKIDITGIKVVDADETRGWSYDTEIEGTGYTVASKTTNTFELQNNSANVNGSSFKVYHSGGQVRKQVSEVSGLWHLEGEAVVALANGYVVRDLTVSSGKVTLPDASSRIHIGLAYTAEIESLRLDNANVADTVQGRNKKVSRLTLRFERTLGGWVGPDRDHMREMKYGLVALYGQPPSFITDDKNITLSPSWNKTGQIVVQQRDPLPMTLLALVPDVVVGGN